MGDVATIEVGLPFRSAEFSRDVADVRLLRGDNVSQGRLDWSGAVRWPLSASVDPKYDMAVGDVVLAMDRPWVGAGLKRSRVRPADVPSYLVQRVARLRANPGLDQGYLAYVIDSAGFSEYLLSVQTGTAIPHISGTQIGGYHFNLPPLAEQQAIAEVLGALDDKIAANTALASRADELMRQTFRSLTADSGVPLSETADFVNGKAFTKGASGTGRVVVRIAELNGGIGGSTVYSDAEVDDKHVARPGDILFAWSGSLTLHRWFRSEAIVNQHIFKVVPQRGYPAWLVYELLRRKLADFKAIAADKATTMGHIQRHHLDEVVEVPSMSDIDRLNPLMSALWDSALNAEQESLTLAATRDALLPQLMSGKLRVRDAEDLIVQAGV
ncbi:MULTISPECIES: restriction endonuclease subunit S [Microbacterium]|uniref:restriction endonuclease subunit S n=1 Tax=Microbacterium TaxID=33882 RepID=UPI00344DD45D